MEDKKIALLFLSWRTLLFIIAFVATSLVPVFGAQFPYFDKELIVSNLPSWVWGFANFDGVHYLKLSKEGYDAAYSQVFLPLYPYLISTLSFKSIGLITGLVISNLSALILLLLLKRLYLLDNSKEIALKSLLMLLCFPTSFFLGSLYPESLFLCLTVAGFYLLRINHPLLGAIAISLSSATKVFGVASVIGYYIELYNSRTKHSLITLLVSALITPLGLVSYMIYLWKDFHNPLLFVSSQSMFGTSRSEDIILLPQTFYRYIKIFLSTPINTQTFWVAIAEVSFSLFLITVIVVSFKKIRLGYWIFIVMCFLLPSLTGTLHSMPRYALMSLFAFPVIAMLLRKHFRIVIIISVILEITFLTMFIRGYWIS